MRKSAVFPVNNGMEGIGEAIAFVEEYLRERGVGRQETDRGTLTAEEALGSLLSHADGKGEIRLEVRDWLGTITVEMSVSGTEYDLAGNIRSAAIPEGEYIGSAAQEAIQNILLRSLAKDIKYSHRKGLNYIRMTLVKSKRAFLYTMLASLISAILTGMLISAFCPESIQNVLNRYILIPVKTIYLNVFKMILAPVVFFSIVSSISGFTSLSDLGRIGGKIFTMYMLTTVIAVAVGIGSFYLLQPGEESMLEMSGPPASSAQSGSAGFSFMDTFMNIVPSNIVDPFRNNDMPQLIFLAVLCGIATGLIGKYSGILRSIFEASGELFLKIAELVIVFMPVSVFCSTMSTVIGLGIRTFLALLGMFGTFIFGLICMMAVYCLLMLLVGRLNPGTFIRKYFPVMLQVLSMASSNAAVPLNMEFCKIKAGISEKVYRLSIPLGSTVNMDGMCIQLSIFALSLAKVYGVPVSTGSLLVMGFTVIILSVGAPGIPGAGVICLTVLLEQLSVPTEAVNMVMGIGPLLGMFLCMSNCTGDVVVTAIVARMTGEMDMDKYMEE